MGVIYTGLTYQTVGSIQFHLVFDDKEDDLHVCEELDDDPERDKELDKE